MNRVDEVAAETPRTKTRTSSSSRLRGWIVALVATTLVAPFATAQTQASPNPDATFLDSTNQPLKLSDYRGKRAVVLLFMRGFKGEFACFHCNNQVHAYRGAYSRLKEAGAEVVAVLPGANDVKGFLEKVATPTSGPTEPNFTVPFPVVLDSDFAACRTFGVTFDPKADEFTFPVSEPATIVIGQDGRVVYTYHGVDPSDRPKADAILDVLLHGAPKAGAIATSKSAPTSPPAPPAATLPWKSYAEGMALAHKDGQPVLLDFHALW